MFSHLLLPFQCHSCGELGLLGMKMPKPSLLNMEVGDVSAVAVQDMHICLLY